MKKLLNLRQPCIAALAQLMIVSTALVLLSCNLNPGPEDIEEQRTVPSHNESALIPRGPIFSFPVSFHRVDLFTVIGNNLTGTVTVEIRNGDGSVVIGSTTVPASSIVEGRNTFIFSPALTLNSGQKYRIQLTRSNPHNYMNGDNIAWRSSAQGTNPYPKGVTNYYPSSVLDYSFVTYSGGYVDQQQTTAVYGFVVSNHSYLWQEFVPQYIWVVHP